MLTIILCTIAIAIAIAAALSLSCCSFVVIGDGYVAFVERLGTFSRQLRPGLHLLLPLIERLRRVNWCYYEETERGGARLTRFTDFRIPVRERIFDPPETGAVTKDRVQVFLNVAVHYRIVDPRKAVYDIEDLYFSMETLIETAIRSTISHITLDEALEGAETIQERVLAELKNIEDEWGLRVGRIRVQNLKTTEALMGATEAMVKAEREARARFVREKAEADAQASKAESQRRILEIEWQTEALRVRSEIEREREKIEGGAATSARAAGIRAKAEADTNEMRNRVDSERIRMMLEAGADTDFLAQVAHAAAFSAFAASEHRGDMVVPFEYARVFGNPVTLRKNV